MTKAGLPEEVMVEARRLISKGHSVSNAARLLSNKFRRTISGYVLSYWLDEKFRERKRQKCRERNAKGRARDARGKGEGESKSPSR